MLGVVLWVGQSDGDAVIWCEVEGELAYYAGGEDAIDTPRNLACGDWVQFQLVISSERKVATNVRRMTSPAEYGASLAQRHAGALAHD